MLHKTIVICLLLASVCFVAIKLYTVELSFPDDASVALAVRTGSFQSNFEVLNSGQQFSDYNTLFIDENGYIGMGFYQVITRFLWWQFPVLTIIIFVVLRIKSNTK